MFAHNSTTQSRRNTKIDRKVVRATSAIPYQLNSKVVEQAVREAATMFPAPCKLTLSISRVTWATSVPILVFLGLSVLDFRPDLRTQQTDVRRASSLNAPYPRGRGHKVLIEMSVFTWLAMYLEQFKYQKTMLT